MGRGDTGLWSDPGDCGLGRYRGSQLTSLLDQVPRRGLTTLPLTGKDPCGTYFPHVSFHCSQPR